MNFDTISLGDLAGYIANELRKNDIDSILVGGACVTIYSKNRYQSYDLDFVSFEDMKKIKSVLANIGFIEKEGCFRHSYCKWFVEFVTPPVAIGLEQIRNFKEMKTPLGTIKMLRPEDSVKDRLASYFYWNDRQGLEQALNICSELAIDYTEIENWAKKEGHLKKFQDFIKIIKK